MTQKLLTNMYTRLLNNKTIYTLAILLICTAASAQGKPDVKKQPVPETKTVPDTKKPSTQPALVRPAAPAIVDVREKLVQLALQNPNYEVADRKVAIASYQIKRAKGAWLAPIVLQGNVNQFSLEKQSTTQNGINPASLYPKYNIGATIPLDLFSAKRNDVRIAKENLSIAQAEKNQRFREIKALVLTKYEDYLLFQQKLDFQSQVTQDARTAYLASEKDFQEGAIKQEDYNKSYRGYTDEKIKQAEFLRNYNVIKLELEAMIGISMDDLLK